ncbi:MAG: hypothetical protein LC797_15925 [Chloroflexi bacterium]|nr:hypothetical protein [Chloroflexota bacterium]
MPSSFDNPDWSAAGFALTIPLSSVPLGSTTLTLAAHTPQHGTWLNSVLVVVPSLGSVPAVAVAPSAVVQAAQPPPAAPARVEIQAPQPGDQVGRSFLVQVLAPGADQVDVFLEPDRDNGGRLAGSAASAGSEPAKTPFLATVVASAGMHTLYLHVHTPGAAREQVLTLPVTVS